ncbi:MAG: DNA-binding protein [Nitrosopumilus sp.]|nr:DNA-binding protein [Nitrosopumilus sp.]MDH3735934.1 DNA-binding protein [Nitrosopumilus sp.]MDH3824001.1 DNA-binding protein [Nitrosopumilus sp.]MDH3834529.1 DNA-binding protein [Nitrosopumilus sp.]
MSNNIKDTIFIGKKPLMTYVTSAIIQLATMPLIKIKARGLSIAHAVDVAQIVLQRTNPAFVIGDVKIDSESLESQDGRTRNVSTIEISIKKRAA